MITNHYVLVILLYLFFLEARSWRCCNVLLSNLSGWLHYGV